jgi:hypothetical protein
MNAAAASYCLLRAIYDDRKLRKHEELDQSDHRDDEDDREENSKKLIGARRESLILSPPKESDARAGGKDQHQIAKYPHRNEARVFLNEKLLTILADLNCPKDLSVVAVVHCSLNVRAWIGHGFAP